MTRYELLVIFDTNGSEEKGESTLDAFTSTLKEEGCSISDIETMGHRTFVREGKNHTQSGHYVKIWLDMETDYADNIHERFRLDEDVFRIMMSKDPSSFRPSDVVEEPTPEPVVEEQPAPTEVAAAETPASEEA